MVNYLASAPKGAPEERIVEYLKTRNYLTKIEPIDAKFDLYWSWEFIENFQNRGMFLWASQDEKVQS